MHVSSFVILVRTKRRGLVFDLQVRFTDICVVRLCIYLCISLTTYMRQETRLLRMWRLWRRELIATWLKEKQTTCPTEQMQSSRTTPIHDLMSQMSTLRTITCIDSCLKPPNLKNTCRLKASSCVIRINWQCLQSFVMLPEVLWPHYRMCVLLEMVWVASWSDVSYKRSHNSQWHSVELVASGCIV